MRHPPPHFLNHAGPPPLDRVMAEIIANRLASARTTILSGLPTLARRIAAAQARIHTFEPGPAMQTTGFDAAADLDLDALTVFESDMRGLAADLEDRADDLEADAERKRLSQRSEIDALRDEVRELRARLDPPRAAPARPSPLQVRERRQHAPLMMGGYRSLKHLPG